MQVSYELAEQDFLDAFQARRRRRVRWLWPVVWTLLAAVILLSGFLYLQCPRALMRLAPLYGLLLFILILVRLLPPWVARMQFRRQPAAQGTRTLDISEKGLISEGATLKSESRWSHYTGWSEAETVFLLIASPLLYIIIPKRAFSAEQLAEFRALLTRHIGCR